MAATDAPRRTAAALAVLMALSTVLAVGTASPAGAACSAGVAPDAEFTGTAIAIEGGNQERDERDGRTHTAALDARTTFEVDEWLVGGGPSGGPSEVVVITNGASGDGSGFQMMGDERPVVVLGERWHVAAYEGDPADAALDAACGGSTRLAAAPWPSADPPDEGSLLALRTILASIVALGIAALVVRHVRRRTPQPDAPAPAP